MSNEIRIDITARNQAKGEFAAARRDADSFAKDNSKFGTSAALSFGKTFASGLTTSFKQAQSLAGPILGTIGIAAAPMIAATLQGAILGGAGIGGVLGGVALASKDPRVAQAGKALGQNLMSDLTQRASVFVQPVLESIGDIQDAFSDMGPTISSIFNSAAQYVAPLTDGLLRAGKGLLTGLKDAVANAGPVIDAIADGVGDVGEKFGEFLSTISNNSDDAASALTGIFDALEGLITVLGPIINGLTQVYGWLDSIGMAGGLLQALNKLFGDDAPEQYTEKINANNEALKKYADSQQAAKDATQAASDAQNDIISGLEYYTERQQDGTDALSAWVAQNLAATEAANGQADALDELSDAHRKMIDPTFKLLRAQNDLKDAQNDVTDATRKFGKNSPQAQEALRKLAEKALDLEGAAGDVAGSLNRGMTPALRSSLRAAGLTEDQINSLAGQFKSAKRAGDNFSKRYKAEASVSGLNGVKGRVNSILDDLRAFDGVWTATMVTNYIRHGKPGTGGGLAHGGIKGAANGATSSDLTWVGENGPELLDLPPGSRVMPAGTSRSLVDNMYANVRGSGTTVMTVDVPNDNEASRFLASMIQKYVRINGGDVQTALGRN